MGANVKRFFADAMVGRLATWMRALGYDVRYVREIGDAELVACAEAEDRVILTRDTLLVKRRGARGRSFLISADRVRDQIREVARRFPPPEGGFLTRCLRCNVPLEEVGKETVVDLVPAYVYKTQERFSRCPACSRVYWAGTHRDHMTGELGEIIREYGGSRDDR